VTEHDFQNFYNWLEKNGCKVKSAPVEIAKFDGMGFGLKAKRDVKVIRSLISNN
jgi:hypothetical protein